MNFISNNVKIKNLTAVDAMITQCLDNTALFIVTSGNVTATVNKKVTRLEKGNILIAKSRDICFFKGQGIVSGFSFDEDGAVESGITKIDLKNIPLLEKLSEENGPMLYPLLELLLCFCDDMEEITPLDSRDANFFAKAVNIMSDNINERVSVNELADSLKISLSHIKRIFSEYAGIGAHDYFNLLKICKAKELLLEGESVTATAIKTGFANQAYFSAAFKRITGISPKDYAGKSVKRKRVEATYKQNKTTKRDLPDYLL